MGTKFGVGVRSWASLPARSRNLLESTSNTGPSFNSKSRDFHKLWETVDGESGKDWSGESSLNSMEIPSKPTGVFSSLSLPKSGMKAENLLESWIVCESEILRPGTLVLRVEFWREFKYMRLGLPGLSGLSVFMLFNAGVVFFWLPPLGLSALVFE